MESIGVARGVVVPVPASELTRREVREARQPYGEWRASSRGRYVPRHVAPTPEQRVVEAGVLVAPPGCITGWASLAWQRSRWFTGLEADGETPRPVDISQPRRLIRPQSGLRLCEERFEVREVAVVDGLRVADPVRAAAYEMRYAHHLRAAVVALCMAAYNDHASLEEIAAWVDMHPSYTGIEQARQALPLGDENCWSPAEVEMVLDWTETVGFRPLTNRPLFDLDGRHIGTPDLIDPRTGVLGEYDGPVHLDAGRRAADLQREGRFRDHGLHPVTMVRADRRGAASWQQRVRAAYAAAARTPASGRRWTLEPPTWWMPTWTVAQRRALTDAERARWLALRVGPASDSP